MKDCKDCNIADNGNLQANCQYCMEYTGPGGVSCSKVVAYTSYFPCQECVGNADGTGSIISEAKEPCKICNPPTPTVSRNGVISIDKRGMWVKKTSGGTDRGPEDCYVCKEEGGKEVWEYQCAAGTECRNGECEPGCNPECQPFCQKCVCTKWGGRAAKVCKKSECKDVIECTLEGYGCGTFGCECILVAFGAPVDPGKRSCPKTQPTVVPIFNELFGVQTNAGCRCECTVKPETCLNDNKIFDATSCLCKPQCDPPCDVNECLQCVKKDGRFGCYSRCTEGKICDGFGNCYNPPAALSLGLIP